jgi:transcriptional regulator with XRE-family HTH domain
MTEADAGPGRRVATVRKVLGMDQKEFAAALGTNQPTVSDWENDKVAIARGTLRLVSDLCRDDRRVFRWLGEGGPMPELVPAASAGPSEVERAYGEAVFELAGAARDIEGIRVVPLQLVMLWLARLHDMIGGR